MIWFQNTNEGATLLSIAVTDRDTGANAQLQYAIGSIDGESCTDDCVSLHFNNNYICALHAQTLHWANRCSAFVNLLVL